MDLALGIFFNFLTFIIAFFLGRFSKSSISRKEIVSAVKDTFHIQEKTTIVSPSKKAENEKTLNEITK